MKVKTVTTYHVFGDGWDDWFDTFEEAKAAYDEACKEEYANVRLYEDTSEIDGDTVEENYLEGQGEWPY
ncbi:MAG: hypothetical protein V4440_04475 [Pseudomonadota bacterium]